MNKNAKLEETKEKYIKIENVKSTGDPSKQGNWLASEVCDQPEEQLSASKTSDIFKSGRTWPHAGLTANGI